jgi:hypothetical protein
MALALCEAEAGLGRVQDVKTAGCESARRGASSQYGGAQSAWRCRGEAMVVKMWS